MSYSTIQSQVSSSGNQPASPQSVSHSLSQSGPQGASSGSQHSNTNANSYTQQHNYDSTKQKKGQQLWNRMKRKFIAFRYTLKCVLWQNKDTSAMHAVLEDCGGGGNWSMEDFN